MVGAAQVPCCWSWDAAGCQSRGLFMLSVFPLPLFSHCPRGWGSGVEGPGTAEPKSDRHHAGWALGTPPSQYLGVPRGVNLASAAEIRRQVKDRDSHLVPEASQTPLLDGQLEKASRVWPGAVTAPREGWEG